MSQDPERGAEPALPEPVRSESVRSEQSREDTDADWGEYPDPDGDDRLRADRPPHWDDF